MTAHRMISWAAITLCMLGLVSVCWRAFHGRPAIPLHEKTIVGPVEEPILIPWGVKVPARIDTGAAVSSLDARAIALVGKGEVEFHLPEKFGGQRIRQRLIGWQTVRSSDGDAERRPVVKIEIRLGSRRLATNFTLNDRSRMDYPVLIGRNTLESNFIVDVSRGKTAPPEWSEASHEADPTPSHIRPEPVR